MVVSKIELLLGSKLEVALWNSMIEILNFDKKSNRIPYNLIFEMENSNSKFKRIKRFKIELLSLGQKILLLSLAKLINKAIERSIIISDEELFLHSLLITSYVRETSNVLKTTNKFMFNYNSCLFHI